MANERFNFGKIKDFQQLIITLVTFSNALLKEMFFASDKDLRKGVPKKLGAIKPKGGTSQNNTKSNSNVATSENIVEQAKIEREQRHLKRELSATITIIQAWWRGRRASNLYYCQLITSFDNKMNDVDKLNTMLISKGLPSLVAPPTICTNLLSILCVVSSHSKKDYSAKVIRSCHLLLIPTLSQLDPLKNLMLILHKQNKNMAVLDGMFRLIMKTLLRSAVANKSTLTSTDSTTLTECLSLLLGRGEPYKIKYTYELGKAFEFYRDHLVEREGLFLLLRKHLLRAVSPLLTSRIQDDDYSSGQSTKASSARLTNNRPAADCVNDRLFALSLYVTQADSGVVDRRLLDFVHCLFSVPMLTLALSNQCLRQFCNGSWTLFPALLSLLSTPGEVHFPSYTAFDHVITSHQWTLGNLTSLLPILQIIAAKVTVSNSVINNNSSNSSNSSSVSGSELSNEEVSNDLLVTFLSVTASWLSAHMIPGVLQGREGIIWRRSGGTHTAVGVPTGLEEQILALLDVAVLRALADRVLALDPPFTSHEAVDWVAYTSTKDSAEIQQALASSGYTIAQAALNEQQAAATWFTAKWAEKLGSSVSSSLQKTFTLSSLLPSFFGSGGGGKVSSSSSGKKKSAEELTAMAQQLMTDNATDVSKSTAEEMGYSNRYVVMPALQSALFKLWALLLPTAAMSSTGSDTVPRKALNYLAFSGHAVERLWLTLLQRDSSALNSLATRAVFDVSRPNHVFSSASSSGKGNSEIVSHFELLMCVVAVLRVVVIALDDSELYEQGKPLPLHQVLPLVRCLKMVLYKLIQSDPALFLPSGSSSSSQGEAYSPGGQQSSQNASGNGNDNNSVQDDVSGEARNLHTYRSSCAKATAAVLSDLYTRWARRPFSATSLWEVEDTGSTAVRGEIRHCTPFGAALLRAMPWAVDFHDRMKLFRANMDAERAAVQGVNDLMSGGTGYRSKGNVIRIRRSRLLEDGMNAIGKLGPAAMKDRIVVRYVNDFGEDEAGIDIGGLFKDFVTDLSGRIFDPQYGLFCSTSSNLLYPNPAAPLLYDQYELDAMYVFLGRVLGKALYENVTLQPQFAHFFLAFLHGKYNFMGLVNDLGTLDPELFRNLMFLKSYEGDLADLCLTFSIADTALGGNKEVELIPGGANVDVTSANRYRYVNLVAKYYLHDRLKRQAGAFFNGLYQVISPDQLGIFCAPELQILISGSQSGVSLEDLKRNTRYAGGYVGIDRHMSRFWAVCEELSSEDRALLVKFVTSCERPPSLGFAALHPAFTIQRVECSDDSRLPTASTCFNVLKLPTYSSQKVLRDKLLLSIRSKSGFDLS